MRCLTIAFLLLIFQAGFAQKLTVYDLTCEHKTDPLGIDAMQPRLSWKIKSPARSVHQTGYTITVATSKDFANNSIVWDSGKVPGDSSILQTYKGTALQSAKRYYWRVKVWSNTANETAVSNVAFFETGLLNKDDWKARWIQPVQDTNRTMPALMVRKDFALNKKIAQARVYVTSHGFYQLFINGEKVSKDVLTPGWTSYNKRLQYQVYDVTDMLKQGNNAVGAMLGDGWYRGSLAWENNWGIWGKKLGLLCQMHVTYVDGTQETIVTDNSWKGTQNGPITVDGIYDGETYDARKEMKGWSTPGFDAGAWSNVTETGFGKEDLIAMQTVPVQPIEEVKPVKIFRTPKGTLVVDMGQNMVGWTRLKVKGKAGDTVTIRHAEVLDKYGEFYTTNFRAAKAETNYILKGGDEEVYEPHFTFYGFRYLAVDGYPGELQPEDITGVVIHSNMQPTGSFVSSDSLLNQLQHNIQWGQKGNFLDVPTDCPQRDERLGWTGDAQAFIRTAAYNMDVAAFFTKWLKDVAADQQEDGKVPFVIPDVLHANATSAGWGDVALIAPWTVYQVFGDKQILADQYPSMKAYVEYIRKTAGDSMIWKGGSVFGDWLYYKPRMENHTEPDGYTNPDMIATAFYAYSTKLLAQTATVLNNNEDAAFYNDLFNKIKQAFIKNYVTTEGRVFSDSQTGYVLALMFNLLPEDLQPKATQYLVNDIKRRGNHLSTGFLGTPYLCHVLSQHGETEVGYDLLLQQTFPSWLYPVKMGATTIWERWDGEKTDSTFQDPGMNSFNHYAYGAIGDWMYRVVAGIEIGAPGYKKIVIQPHPDARLTFAKATFESSYGTIASGWQLKDGNYTLNVTIPANTTATITLPGATINDVTESGKTLTNVFKDAKQQGTDVVFQTGSGTYNFAYKMAMNNADTNAMK